MSSPNTSYALPPLPEYTLKPLPPLIPWLPDAYLQMALPIISYWAVSLIYHAIDVYDWFPQYRLHTPAEIVKRNHVTRYEVFRDVIIQQAIQVFTSLIMAFLDEAPSYGREEHDMCWYAQKIRLAQHALPMLLATLGFNSAELASSFSASQPTLAAVLKGGSYPSLVQTAMVAGQETIVPAFASWELAAAKFLYWYAVPAFQFAMAILIMDTWEYCLHRSMHMNRWLYVTFHSRHHRLYVPYAYGALYNHPIEGFFMDTVGAGISFLSMGMTVRQSMWFFSGSTIKTVLDHSGYAFPWDPLHFIFPNNAAYHDIHHQSWGIKTNFSQPFFTFWDKWCGTMYKGDVTVKYEQARRAAQQKLDQQKETEPTTLPAEMATSSALDVEESKRSQPISAPRCSRKKAPSISQSSAGNLKGLTNKVNESLHGRGANVLGVEGSH